MVEGVLIVVAALMILREASLAVLAPQVSPEPWLGLALNGVATSINAACAAFLLRFAARGRQRLPPMAGTC